MLARAARLYGTSIERLSKLDDFEGCANLVYQYEQQGQPRVLRISCRPDRTVEHIQAELDFIRHLGRQRRAHHVPPAGRPAGLHGSLHGTGHDRLRAREYHQR